MTTRTPPGRLTPRERAVLTQLARGGSQAEVAARLNLTPSGVKNHIYRASRRLGATTTVHLLALAITAGDIDPDCATGTEVAR